MHRRSPPAQNGDRAATPKGLVRRGESGVVYVEFLIAFLPLFVFFSGLVQLGALELANLVVKHAAVTAARAAIVVLPDDPAFYDQVPVNRAEGKRLSDIQRAATMPLSAIDSSPQVKVRFPTSAGGTDTRTSFRWHDLVRVRVEYTCPCRIPIGGPVACGLAGTRLLTGEAAMPNQGANYDYPRTLDLRWP